MSDTSIQTVDPTSLAALSASETDPVEMLRWEVMLPTDGDGRPAAPDLGWIVRHGAASGEMTLHALGDAPLRSLFRGGRVVQEFGDRPPPGYDLVFAFIERPLALFAAALVPTVRDAEFEKLFAELRRRPDGRYQSPLYRYAQAVLRSLLLLRPTSESEFDAVLRRLARSARSFGAGATSTHYFDNALQPLLRA